MAIILAILKGVARAKQTRAFNPSREHLPPFAAGGAGRLFCLEHERALGSSDSEIGARIAG